MLVVPTAFFLNCGPENNIVRGTAGALNLLANVCVSGRQLNPFAPKFLDFANCDYGQKIFCKKLRFLSYLQ